MLSEEQLKALPDGIQKLFQQLERDITEKICVRIEKIGRLLSSDVRRLEELSRIGYDLKAIEKDVSGILAISERDVRKILYNSAEAEYADTLNNMHKSYIPFAKNDRVQELVETISKATAESFSNMANTIGFVNSVNRNGITLKKGKWEELSEYYRNVTDYSALQIRTGQSDFYSAVRKSINSMADWGLSYVEYESGRIRRLDTSVRSAILGAQARLSMSQAEIVGEQIDADGYEITLHSFPRPSHEWIGGRQFNIKTFQAQVKPLLEEANCYHRAIPILLGVSTPSYTKAQREAVIEANNKEYTWRGKKTISGYEVTQIQRRYETEIRQCKDRIFALTAAGDKAGSRKAKERLTSIRQEYSRMFKEHGLFRSVGLTVNPQRTSVIRRVKAR